MELRSARKYWHVKHEKGDDVFEQYQHVVVGILWQTMFQFQTFFGTEPFFVYGIQLLPLTAASEQRDDPEWIRAMYADFAASCVTDCASSGWSIQQLAALATGGQADTAFEQAMALPSSVFETPGGHGHPCRTRYEHFNKAAGRGSGCADVCFSYSSDSLNPTNCSTGDNVR